MKTCVIISVCRSALAFVSCSRKSPQAGPAAPEVLVTTVRRATCRGCWNASRRWMVSSTPISTRRCKATSSRATIKEGSVVKKGDLLFQIDPRPFEAALAQAKGTLAKDKANQIKADADEKRALDLFNKKVISDQERDTAFAAADSTQSKCRSRRSGGETGRAQSRLHENHRADRRRRRICHRSSWRSRRSEHRTAHDHFAN